MVIVQQGRGQGRSQGQQRVGLALDERALRALESRLAGTLIRAGDAEYDAARRVHDITVDRYPAAIVRPAGSADVIHAVNFARQQELRLAVRSGGHSGKGDGTGDDALVIDLSGLKEIRIDPATGLASVQPGVTSGELAPQAAAYGLGLSTGDTPSVALGGLTLGGGIGFMVRKYGLTIDSLREVELVTADGRLLVASETEHPELFWGLRGGGGNFGIATRFTFQLRPVGTVLGGAIALPATPEVLRGYVAYALQAPDELTTIGVLMPLPPAPFVPADRVGDLALVILVCYLGDPEAGQRAVAPLRALAEPERPLAELLAPMPYPALFNLTQEGAQPHAAAIRSMYLRQLSGEAIDAILAHGRRLTSPTAMVQIRPLGGALARVPNDATAFAHRDKPLMLTVLNTWQTPDPAEAARHRAWTESLWQALRPLADGVYVNFLADEGEARIQQAYSPESYARLTALKRQYDPGNLFRLNQNIRPQPQPQR